jgi:hypothetical protein
LGDDMSLQEYLNQETKRLKKDRNKQSESMKYKMNEKNLDDLNVPDNDDLKIYDDLEGKNLEIRFENKKFDSRKHGNLILLLV